MTTKPTALARQAVLLLVLCTWPLPFSAFADVAAIVARVEQLPRTQRLVAYQTAVVGSEMTEADRASLIKEFSRHAKRVSPLYGPSRFPFDQLLWVSILSYGFKADSKDADTAWALCKILINQQDYRSALPVAAAFEEAHPGHHHAIAWHAWCRSKVESERDPGDILTFPIHFCVLTRDPAGRRTATIEQCRKECEILNATFRTLDNQPLVRFVFKGFSSYEYVASSDSEFVRFGDSTMPYDSDEVARAFNNCTDPRIRDPHAINFYIYDSYSREKGFKDGTSHGKRNSNRPYVLIDWTRLNNQHQNPEPHEMGHAFGLEHVGVPGATIDTPTNIMCSIAEEFGSGGRRDLGFTEAQSALILYHARRTWQRLGLTNSTEPVAGPERPPALLPPPGEVIEGKAPFRFAFVGDSRGNQSVFGEVLAGIKQDGVALIIRGGDIVKRCTKRQFEWILQELMEQYMEVPVCIAPGDAVECVLGDLAFVPQPA